jgi:hypothetical protein
MLQQPMRRRLNKCDIAPEHSVIQRDPAICPEKLGFRGGWSRTNIHGFKGRCPAIERRPGSSGFIVTELTLP